MSDLRPPTSQSRLNITKVEPPEYHPIHLRLHRLRRGLRESRRCPPSWVGALNSLRRGFWVNRCGECFAMEPMTEHRGGACAAPVSQGTTRVGRKGVGQQ